MRVLFVAMAGRRHLHPLVPLAWACRAAGHDVHIVGSPQAVDDMTRTGLPAVVINGDAGSDVDDLVAFAWGWEPDVVVSDTACHTGVLTAGALGVPAVSLGRETPPVSPEYTRLFERFGLDPLREAALTVDPTPASLRASEPSPTRIAMRHVPYHGPGVVPRWLGELRERPRICVTCEHAVLDASRDAIAALAESEMDVVVMATTAQVVQLGRLPDIARAAECTPLQLILPHCDLVIQQGGLATTLTAAALGVPQLVITNGPGCETTGDCLAASGAGVHLPYRAQHALRAAGTAVAELLADPKYRSAARRLRAEIECQPAPAEIVAVLEALESDA